MILKTMWGKRVDMLPGDAPELMVAWDEYCVDGNESGFEDDCQDARKSWGGDLAEWRMVDIHVSEHAIGLAFKTAVTAGSVVSVDEQEG